MAEVDSIFSDDDAFFGIATGPNEQTEFNLDNDDDDEDYENNPMYDPPSKICGGVVFDKFRSAGKKLSKASVDLSTKKDQSSSKKKKEYFQRQTNLPLTANNLVNKLTNKIMRRKKDSSTADAEEETSYQEASYQPELVVPSSIHLSSMSKSTSSSPWVSGDSFDNDDDAFLAHRRQPKEEMGDSTAQSTNKKADNGADANNAGRSRRNLHILLDEMKDFNDLVQERSNVLQRGIANIAIELEEEIQEEIKTSAVGTPKPEIKEETCDEMEKLEKERSFYRSEAETLRLEMKEIKAQLDEIKKCLPKMNTPNSKIAASISDAEEEVPIPSPYPTRSRRMRSPRSPRSPRFLETLDLPPLADSSKSTFRSELHDILTDLGRTTQVMRNAEAIVQQHHHNHPTRASSFRENRSIANSIDSQNGTKEESVKQKKAEFYKYQQDSASVSTSNSISLSTANRSFSGYPISNSENSLSASARRRMTDKTYRELRRRFREQQGTSTISEISSIADDEVAIVSPSISKSEEESNHEYEAEELESLRQSWHELLHAPSETSTNKTDTSAEF